MKNEVEIKDKPLLTIKEAASLYNIGENKLRDLIEDEECDYVLYVGNKRLIKRKEFDKLLVSVFQYDFVWYNLDSFLCGIFFFFSVTLYEEKKRFKRSCSKRRRKRT